MTSTELARWNADVQSGDPARIGPAAERLAEIKDDVETEWVFTLYDNLWRAQGGISGDIMEGSGTDPRNDLPSAKITQTGESRFIDALMECRKTLVGITLETAGLRYAYYVDTHEYKYENTAWTSTSNCLGIWDILNYLIIYPLWFLPLQIQPISHAVFIGPLVTVIENMIAECALRVQSGIMEFLDNALSLNLDMRTWFGTLLQSNGNIFEMLKTPVYVVRTNPFLDTSPLVAKTVRMQSCGEVIKEITKPYGVDVRVDLWLPGDAQPDPWANLDQPTYVVTVKDRSQIEGPTKTVLDSVIRTVVDLEGSLVGKALDPLLNPRGEYVPTNFTGMHIAPALGVDFVPPWTIIIAPEPGDKSSLISCEIVDHTPKGWQLTLGGKSPKWLNDLINATMSWLIDSAMIIVGFTGVPSNILDGFLNDAFFAFQTIEHYTRRSEVGPYHPAIETMTATNASPYNIEALFSFIAKLWDTRGYTSAKAVFRNGEQYKLGKDIFRGALFSIVYMGRKRLFTDYIENIMWRFTRDERNVLVQVGDGKAEEAPIAKHQRFISGLQEAFNVLTLAPNS
ncbi:hypothetical protein MSP7336_01795 [Mycobacterium shimoidei]|uniref:Gp28/Gp37-like domain-containing protein n=1 Tax=Mycobacterium shimoidei TaxID=29313 RepID=A0A375YXG2_MYCSH|nr:hypothetical protein [Mycobacterium shimoidei]SRX93556.1 hypothetical protein MSP7336_01795 [Mycobacterium shimoidei]